MGDGVIAVILDTVHRVTDNYRLNRLCVERDVDARPRFWGKRLTLTERSDGVWSPPRAAPG